MKELSNYLLENIKPIFEASSELSFLLITYDDAIKYFEEHDIFNDRRIKTTGLSKDDINLLYEYAETNNMPCPIVANYQRKPGKFVFRRWVAKINDELDIDVYKNAGPYQGLHNTSIKEDGKYFPSSEDVEYVIAYSHNRNNMNMTDPDNIEFVSKKQLESDSKLEQLMAFYVQNEEACLRMIMPLKDIKSELYKLPNINSTTNEWIEAGEYEKYGGRVNKTPKTDIISKDGKYKISLKKTGGAQLMSGAECESRATLLSCIDYLSTEEDKILLRSLLEDGWYKPKKDGKTIAQKKADGDEELAAAIPKIKELSYNLNEIISRNHDFKKAIMYEAMTGEIKFGKDSPATANYVLVWDDLGNKNILYTVDEYLNKCYNSARFDIGFKTAKNSMVVLRIEVK